MLKKSRSDPGLLLAVAAVLPINNGFVGIFKRTFFEKNNFMAR